MLDALHNDVLLELLGWCEPADVQTVAQTCRRLRAFVDSFRAHLPRYTTACSITLLDGRQMRVRLRQSSPTRFTQASAKKVVFMSRLHLQDGPPRDSLTACCRITSLSLYGTGPLVAQVADRFVRWLLAQLHTRRGKLEFVSLRNLDLRDVSGGTWRSLLDLCSSRSRFSCVNCTFARLSLLYELYDRLPRLEYLNESYSTIDEEDVEEAAISRKNRELVERIAEGDVQAVDLGSLRDVDGSFLFDLITWVHSKTPNDFSHLCLRKTGENLRSRLLAHEYAEGVAGMIAYRNHFHPDLCLLVDVQQMATLVTPHTPLHQEDEQTMKRPLERPCGTEVDEEHQAAVEKTPAAHSVVGSNAAHTAAWKRRLRQREQRWPSLFIGTERWQLHQGEPPRTAGRLHQKAVGV
ncbi:hypothetical protein M3Y99_01297700 [Aphelenchoides fujianensis]|nr:hypothetical protein M3Y99_01297700 [Aphelenchoides fujianensis]